MIEASFLPSASPHQPAPSCCLVWASPDLSQLKYLVTAPLLAAESTMAAVFVAFRKPPPFWYQNASIRSRLMSRHAGGCPALLSFWRAVANCDPVVGIVVTPAALSMAGLTSMARGDQSFGKP